MWQNKKDGRWLHCSLETLENNWTESIVCNIAQIFERMQWNTGENRLRKFTKSPTAVQFSISDDYAAET